MVRLATKKDIPYIDELRKELFLLHAAGRPEMFRQEFNTALREHTNDWLDEDDRCIYLFEEDGAICGLASVHFTEKEASTYFIPHKFCTINEIIVDKSHRGKGIGKALVAQIREDALAKGFDRLELNMWEFNESALAFYEALGFKTYRRYMDMVIT